MEFYNLPKELEINYPTGPSIYGAYKLSIEYANAICNYFPNIPIFILVRGSSGAMLAALTASVLIRRRKRVHIFYSRKGDKESCHSSTLDQFDVYYNNSKDNPAIIIIDDFIVSGNTLENILIDLYNIVEKETITIDMLCISNYWNEEHFEKVLQNIDIHSSSGSLERIENIYNMLKDIRVIVCNNPNHLKD